MTPNETSPDQAVEAVAVTQADREAAAKLAEALAGSDGISRMPERFRNGSMDDKEAVQAFARHRLSAIEWQDIATAPEGEWFLGRWYAAGKGGHCSWVAVQMRIDPVSYAGRRYYETWDGRLLSDPAYWCPLPAARTALELG